MGRVLPSSEHFAGFSLRRFSEKFPARCLISAGESIGAGFAPIGAFYWVFFARDFSGKFRAWFCFAPRESIGSGFVPIGAFSKCLLDAGWPDLLLFRDRA